MHRTTKDSRNHLLWQPSEKSLLNVEEDEAGKLAAFRERYGRGFDMEAPAAVPAAAAAAPGEAQGEEAQQASAVVEPVVDTLADLLSGYAAKAGMGTGKVAGGMTAKERAKKTKGKK